jgi:hypothetical protein
MKWSWPSTPVSIQVCYEVNTWTESWVDAKRNSVTIGIQILDYRRNTTYDVAVYAERQKGKSLYTFRHSPYERKSN